MVREQIAEEIEELRTIKRLGVLPQDIALPNTYELKNAHHFDRRVGGWNALRAFDVVVAAPNGISPAYADVPSPPQICSILS